MVATAPDLRHDVDEILPGVVADRRHLHQNPELGYQEVKTAAFVADRLRALGVEDVRTGIAKTGVTGLIKGTGSGPGAGKVVLLRADMDALPIQEQNEVDYHSTVPGTMHACGHDAHTAMLLGTTRLLLERRDRFAGTVKVLFQPAEEGGAGARVMIGEGVLDDPRVDAAFGIHVAQEEPVGTVSVRPGPMMAAADRFTIVVKGKGGHGAQPHLCIDPIAVGAQLVTALQTIVSREVDPTEPAVVTAPSAPARPPTSSPTPPSCAAPSAPSTLPSGSNSPPVSRSSSVVSPRRCGPRSRSTTPLATRRRSTTRR
jgi:amidohydrolase